MNKTNTNTIVEKGQKGKTITYIIVCAAAFCAIAVGLGFLVLKLAAKYTQSAPASGVVNMMVIRDSQMVFLIVCGGVIAFVILTVGCFALAKHMYKRLFTTKRTQHEKTFNFTERKNSGDSEICRMTAGLLPFFVSDACPDDIRVIIETHMHTCPECRAEFERLGGRFDKRSFPRVKQWSTGRVISILIGCAAMIGAFIGLINLYMMIPESGKVQSIPDFGTLMGNMGIALAVFIALFVGGIVILVALWQLLKFIYRRFLFPVREPGFETYTVREGDTLISIVEKQYGDDGALALLKFLNNSIEQAVPGQELRLRLKA